MDVKSLENIISIPSSARGLRIFVVDPDTSSLMCTASMLERQSYKVTTTELANIALSLIREREKQYDLVIAEVDMPQMDEAQPNAILKLMNVPNLTHRHVASHLQKYRLSVMRKKMDFSLPNSNIPTTSKAQENIDNTKELLKDVKSNCSAGESNSRSTTNSSCDIGGVVNFQEGNHYSPGLERQDQFSMGQTENQNNMLEYFEQVANLEVNDVTMDDLPSPENISMCVRTRGPQVQKQVQTESSGHSACHLRFVGEDSRPAGEVTISSRIRPNCAKKSTWI
ncbi:Trans-acting T-cell-specific transcription factor GATA-3 [Datura stramonium]|uniref:Trans-acting T-cell-specific transcription factor GATA-3 n=1 Tax=Datura stramonium TaxID=4076 RepID=A0ABS8UNC6_DATST|nr:Trans-acting T-cell-specific transcription factor GATA-3 [Datura stramonium]